MKGELNETVVQAIKRRMEKRIPYAFMNKFLCSESVYIAGNACNIGTPNDIDMYPAESKDQFRKVLEDIRGSDEVKILSETANAVTLQYNGCVIQLCHYFQSSLAGLVDSFDFSHIQIGISLSYDEQWSISDVYYTGKYLEAHILHTSEYTGSLYPLSSLMRVFKYAKRGDFAGNSYKVAVVNILRDIISRGWDDYSDYKDQCDAVDLMLLQEVESNAMYDLFSTCFEAGLVRSNKSVKDQVADAEFSEMEKLENASKNHGEDAGHEAQDRSMSFLEHMTQTSKACWGSKYAYNIYTYCRY